jgi:hypothetical protein
MSKPFATEEFRNQVASWQNRTADPNAGLGTSRALGSVWDRSGTFPTTPLETFFKLNANDQDWIRENLVNLRVYNVVRDFGAVPDGVTSCVTPINNAVAAAQAAGGGIIYFPPAVNGYAVYTRAPQPGIITVENCQNILFMGDGYNSWIKVTGDALASFLALFYIVTSSQRIAIYNLRCNTTGLFNFAVQTHYVQMSVANPPVINQSPHDVQVYNCWFDPIRGDQVRLLGGNGAFGAGFDVTGCRVLYNTFNMDVNTRTGVSVQRDVNQVSVLYNWFTENLQQQIDFEPAGGDGPAEFIINHNIFDLFPASNNNASITLSGVDITHPSQRNTCSFNLFLEGGTIEGVNVAQLQIVGNVMQVTEVTTGLAGIELRNPTDLIIDSNILIVETVIPAGGERAALLIFTDAPGVINRVEVSNNLLKAIATTEGNVCLQLESSQQLTASGNVCFLDQDTIAVGSTAGIQIRNVDQIGQDWVIVGNLVICTRDRVNDGIQIDTENGLDIHNVVTNDNYTRNTLQGIRYISAGGGLFLDWRSCTGNNAVDSTTTLITPPTPSNVGVTCNGSAAPAAQITTFNVAGNPNTRVTAPNGSLCANTQGVAGAVIFTKDTGTGNTGWAIVGPSEFVFGTLASSAATAARYLAPGAGQLIESTTEIQMAFPRAGVIRNMRIDCDAGIGGGTNTYTLRINGVASALSIAILNTATSGGPDTSQVAIAAGALVSMQVTKTVAPATPQTNIVVTVELTG